MSVGRSRTTVVNKRIAVTCNPFVVYRSTNGREPAVVDGSEAGIRQAQSILPLAANRVVLVRDVQGLSQTAREVVEQVVASPPEGLVLILSGQKPSGS